MDNENNPNLKNDDSLTSPEKNIPVLTTYEKAINQSTKKKEVSKAREYIISKKEKKTTVNQIKEKRSYKKIFITLILLAVSVGIYFAVTNLPFSFFTKNETVKTNSDNGFFKIDEIKRLNTDNQSKEGLISNIQKAFLEKTENNKLVSIELYSTQSNPETQEVIELNVSSLAFMNQILESRAPERLLRSIDKKFVFGYITKEEVNRPFIFLSSNDFQNTFAGMLEWEDVILEDVNPVFRIIPTIKEPEEGEELSIEETEKIEFLNQIKTAKFIDLIIQNKDTRTLITENRTSLLVYSFINSKFVIIADHPSTLEEIKARVITSQLIRQ